MINLPCRPIYDNFFVNIHVGIISPFCNLFKIIVEKQIFLCKKTAVNNNVKPRRGGVVVVVTAQLH